MWGPSSISLFHLCSLRTAAFEAFHKSSSWDVRIRGISSKKRKKRRKSRAKKPSTTHLMPSNLGSSDHQSSIPDDSNPEDDRIHIHYENFGSSDDEEVPVERVRLRSRALSTGECSKLRVGMHVLVFGQHPQKNKMVKGKVRQACPHCLSSRLNCLRHYGYCTCNSGHVLVVGQHSRKNKLVKGKGIPLRCYSRQCLLGEFFYPWHAERAAWEVITHVYTC